MTSESREAGRSFREYLVWVSVAAGVASFLLAAILGNVAWLIPVVVLLPGVVAGVRLVRRRIKLWRDRLREYPVLFAERDRLVEELATVSAREEKRSGEATSMYQLGVIEGAARAHAMLLVKDAPVTRILTHTVVEDRRVVLRARFSGTGTLEAAMRFVVRREADGWALGVVEVDEVEGDDVARLLCVDELDVPYWKSVRNRKADDFGPLRDVRLADYDWRVQREPHPPGLGE
jgi:hypothetical protein